jgi:hypothetical protein
VTKGQSPFVTKGQSPFVTKGQSPFVTKGQSPFVTKGQSPFVTKGQSPFVTKGQSPFVTKGQSPFVTKGQSPFVTTCHWAPLAACLPSRPPHNQLLNKVTLLNQKNKVRFGQFFDVYTFAPASQSVSKQSDFLILN